MKIVIADDDPEILGMLSKALWAAGYEPLLASDAMHVIVCAQKQKPAAILLDINMPAGSGMGALKLLKMSRKTRPIPVIVMSATADAAAPAQALEMGAAAFFAKPVDVVALLMKLQEVVCGAAATPAVKETAKPCDPATTGRELALAAVWEISRATVAGPEGT